MQFRRRGTTVSWCEGGFHDCGSGGQWHSICLDLLELVQGAEGVSVDHGCPSLTRTHVFVGGGPGLRLQVVEAILGETC